MNIKMRAGVAMIAIAVTLTGVVAAPPPVQAQGLLDALFKSPAQRERERLARQRARQEAVIAPQPPKPVAEDQRPDLTAPTSLTPLVKVDFSRLSDPITTGAIGDMGLAPLGIDAFTEGRAVLADLSLRALPEAAEAVIEHYSAQPEYLWVAGTSVTERALEVVAVLDDAMRVGFVGRTHLQGRGPGWTASTSPRAPSARSKLMAFEMKLSVAVANYSILDATRGRGRSKPDLRNITIFKRKSPDTGGSGSEGALEGLPIRQKRLLAAKSAGRAFSRRFQDGTRAFCRNSTRAERVEIAENV